MDESSPPPSAPELSLLEWLLAALLVPLALAAWLALITAQAGQLSVAASVAGTAGGLAVVLAVLFRHRRPTGTLLGGRGPVRQALASARPMRPPAMLPTPLSTALLPELVTVALAIALVGWMAPAATPWPAYLDASWYVNTGARIADEGRLVFRPAVLGPAAARRVVVSTLADGRAHGLPFPPDSTSGFHNLVYAVPDVEQDQVVPYHPPLFASWIALWIRLFGRERAGDAVLPWAVVYLLATAALARTAWGRTAALAAVLLLGGGPVFAYYGVTPYAEVAAGALVLTGYVLLSRLTGRTSRLPAAVAGLALGLAVLVKVDAVVPLLVALGWWVWARRREGGLVEGLCLAGGTLVPLAHGLLLADGVSRFYVLLNGGGVLTLAHRRPGPVLVAVVALAVVVALAWRWPTGRQGVTRRQAVRRGLALVVVLAVGAGMALEQVSPPLAPPGMLAILSWLVTPLGLWAAVAGLVLALEADRPSGGPLLAAALIATPAVLMAPVVTQTLSPLYTARRLVLLALPTVAVLAGVAVQQGLALRRRSVTLATAAGALLVLVAGWQTARPFHVLRDFGGGPVIASRLAAYGRQEDVLLFPSTLDGADSGRMAAAVENLTGRPTAVLASPEVDNDQVARAVAAWQAEGRRVFFLTDDVDRLPPLEGYRSEQVGEEALVSYGLGAFPSLPVRTQAVALSFLVYELVPEEDSG